MASAHFTITLRRWFDVRLFGRRWVVYTLPGMKGQWRGFRPHLAWERA
jgi:hypothetical protein